MFGSGGELEEKKSRKREHCMVFKQESEPEKKKTAV
jgi:hypothetical protein